MLKKALIAVATILLFSVFLTPIQAFAQGESEEIDPEKVVCEDYGLDPVEGFYQFSSDALLYDNPGGSVYYAAQTNDYAQQIGWAECSDESIWRLYRVGSLVDEVLMYPSYFWSTEEHPTNVDNFSAQFESSNPLLEDVNGVLSRDLKLDGDAVIVYFDLNLRPFTSVVFVADNGAITALADKDQGWSKECKMGICIQQEGVLGNYYTSQTLSVDDLAMHQINNISCFDADSKVAYVDLWGNHFNYPQGYKYPAEISCACLWSNDHLEIRLLQVEVSVRGDAPLYTFGLGYGNCPQVVTYSDGTYEFFPDGSISQEIESIVKPTGWHILSDYNENPEELISEKLGLTPEIQ